MGESISVQLSAVTVQEIKIKTLQNVIQVF